MIGILGPASPWARETIALGLDVSLKATVLVLLALAIHLGSGRRRALLRSVLWNACLLGLLVLPVAAVAFPGLRVACLPGREAPADFGPVREAVAPPPLSPDPLDGPNLIESPLVRPQAPTRLDWASAVVLAYLAIAAALAVRLALSLAAVGALVRTSVPVEERPWVEALDRWRGRLGLSRGVRLARSSRVGVPVVVGWLRPTILLPEGLVDRAAPPTIDAILLHELAHVRRGDYPWNLLLRLVQAIYWPHPLVWPVGRIVAGVREQACDDLCVSWLGGTADYRATLLEMASGLVRRPGPSLGLAMSRTTRLGRRLAWIERSEGVSRCLLGWPSRTAIAVAVVAAVGVLGSVKLARSASAPPPKAEEPKAQDDARPRDDQAPRPDAPDRKDPPRRLRVERLKRGDIRRTTTQPCTVHAFQSADLFAKVSGYLKSQAVDIGDRVKRGDVLAVIEAPELSREADRASATVAQAQAMHGQATVRVVTARSEVTAAEATVAQAQVEVVAPHHGPEIPREGIRAV